MSWIPAGPLQAAGCVEILKGELIMVQPGFPVPADKIESGSGQRGWVYCTFYGATLEEVKQKRANYFKEYPPQGYDTHTPNNIYKHPDGYYAVTVKRWSSCD